jgi:hypothetical protein
MSNITLVLTDTSGNENFTNKTPRTTSLSDDSDEESIENHKNTSSKLYLFLKHYIKQLKLVCQSIIPDFQSFKNWQIIILILYATFNVIFSILVNQFFSFY